MGKRPKMWVAHDAVLEQQAAPQGLWWIAGTDGMWGLREGQSPDDIQLPAEVGQEGRRKRGHGARMDGIRDTDSQGATAAA